MVVKLVTAVALLSLVACAPAPKVSPAAASYQTQTTPSVLLGPGDVIDVKFRFLPEMDYQQTIRPDGKISLQMVDDVTAAGMSPAELDEHLTQLYSKKLKSPEITVVVVSLANQVVYVGGEVLNPGVLPLSGSMSALQAVVNAGGLLDSAKPESALIIRKGEDNQPVPIPVNLQNVLYGATGNVDLQLQPSDVVYVPKSAIAKANLFVKQYIQDLFLFRGVTLGFGYELHAEKPE